MRIQRMLLALAMFLPISAALRSAAATGADRVLQLLDASTEPSKFKASAAELLSPSTRAEDIMAAYEKVSPGGKALAKAQVLNVVIKRKDAAFGPWLEGLLDGPSDPTSLDLACLAAGEVGGPALIASLRRLALDRKAPVAVRMRAAFALGRNGDHSGAPEALMVLAAGRRTEDATGQFLAGEALEGCGNEEDLPRLRDLQASRNAWTRVNAFSAEYGIRARLAPDLAAKAAVYLEASHNPSTTVQDWLLERLIGSRDPESDAALKAIADEPRNPLGLRARQAMSKKAFLRSQAP